jgi:hypothetical protein
VHNFMTYGENVVIKPGPRLNLVLGPNGTGKSSLVCALCVCLGGALKLLGRADNPGDFIRRGTTEARVAVVLSGGSPAQPDVTIERGLAVRRQQTGASGATDVSTVSWYSVDRKASKEKAVREIVADMGVQLDNLCQFLPQDKVVEFARLDARQLLEATERAVGRGELHARHEELKAKATALNELVVVSRRFCVAGGAAVLCCGRVPVWWAACRRAGSKGRGPEHRFPARPFEKSATAGQGKKHTSSPTLTPHKHKHTHTHQKKTTTTTTTADRPATAPSAAPRSSAPRTRRSSARCAATASAASCSTRPRCSRRARRGSAWRTRGRPRRRTRPRSRRCRRA